LAGGAAVHEFLEFYQVNRLTCRNAVEHHTNGSAVGLTKD
jgi:hypothetical protein